MLHIKQSYQAIELLHEVNFCYGGSSEILEKSKIRISRTGTSHVIQLLCCHQSDSRHTDLFSLILMFGILFCGLINPTHKMGKAHRTVFIYLCIYLQRRLQKVTITFAKVMAGEQPVAFQICHSRVCCWVQLSAGCDHAPEASADGNAMESLDPDIFPNHGGRQHFSLAFYCMGIWS